MKKVLVYGMTDNPGGMESFFMNYYRQIHSDELFFDFITDCDTIAYRQEIEEKGSKVFFIPSRRKNLLKHMQGLRKAAKGYDIIYFNALSASEVFSVFAVKGLRGKKVIVHSHNNNVEAIARHMRLRGFLDRLADQRFACSEEAADFMFGKSKDKAIVIKNAIDVKRFLYDEQKRAALRNQYGLDGRFVVGHVGRLCYQKNTLFLIEAFAEVVKLEPSARLVIIGDGEDREQVEKKIQELGLKDSVMLMGVQSNVNEWMQAMDVFVLPSRFEGLPVVAIEAQTAGLHCVFSDTFSRKSDVTGNVTFLSLEDTTEYWARQILSHKDDIRYHLSNKIDSAGYNIEKEAEHFKQILLSAQ